MTLDEALKDVPIVAILRGIKPSEVVATADALLAAGVKVIEVPLNSPSPLDSIEILAGGYKGRVVAGAGTVLTVDDVEAVARVGGQIIVSPNANQRVIARAEELGCTAFPGVFSPTEAFSAIQAGARYLKLFPASTGGPAHLRAMKAVLPRHVQVFAVGGVAPDTMQAWREAGATGFGLGSELYRLGQAPEVTREKAQLAAQMAVRATS